MADRAHTKTLISTIILKNWLYFVYYINLAKYHGWRAVLRVLHDMQLD